MWQPLKRDKSNGKGEDLCPELVILVDDFLIFFDNGDYYVFVQL